MEKAERATKKQQVLLQFVDDFIREHDYGPSYREIMQALEYKSVSTVATHVEGLIAKGYLRRKDNTARSLEIVAVHAGNEIIEAKTASSAVSEISAKFTEITPQQQKILLEALEILGHETDASKLKARYAPDTSE